MVPISNMSSMINFPKLNGNNHYAWSDNIMSALQLQLLWLIVDGQRPSPPKPPTNPPVNPTNNKLLPVSYDEYNVRIANSKLELSQLLFISVRQRELIRVPTSLVYLLIYTTTGLCTLFPHLHVICDVTLSLLVSHCVT